MVYEWRSENKVWETFSPSILWALTIKRRASGLAASSLPAEPSH